MKIQYDQEETINAIGLAQSYLTQCRATIHAYNDEIDNGILNGIILDMDTVVRIVEKVRQELYTNLYNGERA